jgi:hypothetical protein
MRSRAAASSLNCRLLGTRRNQAVSPGAVHRYAHAILAHGGDFVPISSPALGRTYWVNVGGDREHEDDSLGAAHRRQALEEAGTVVDVAVQLLVLTVRVPLDAIAREHYFLAADRGCAGPAHQRLGLKSRMLGHILMPGVSRLACPAPGAAPTNSGEARCAV